MSKELTEWSPLPNYRDTKKFYYIDYISHIGIIQFPKQTIIVFNVICAWYEGVTSFSKDLFIPFLAEINYSNWAHVHKKYEYQRTWVMSWEQKQKVLEVNTKQQPYRPKCLHFHLCGVLNWEHRRTFIAMQCAVTFQESNVWTMVLYITQRHSEEKQQNWGGLELRSSHEACGLVVFIVLQRVQVCEGLKCVFTAAWLRRASSSQVVRWSAQSFQPLQAET